MHEAPTVVLAAQLALINSRYNNYRTAAFEASCRGVYQMWKSGPAVDAYHHLLGNSWRRCQGPGSRPQWTQTGSAKLKLGHST